MALVGEAHVIVRAITNSVEKDIRKAFSGMDGVGGNAGSNLGRSFNRGFNKTIGNNTFSRIANGLRSLVPAAEGARRAFTSAMRTSYTLGTALMSIVGGISSVISGLGALGGAALGAMGSVAALGGVLAGVIGGFGVAKLALGGIGKAVTALNKPATGGGGGGGGSAASGPTAAQVAANAAAREAAARRVADAEKALALVIERNREDMVDANNEVLESQLELNEALKEGREEIQQLGFDAEDAALAEQKAAIELGKARETLLRVQDLPPNSRARQEAELAFAEAELNLRKAKDRSADLNKEQDRLARTGVNGTQVVRDATDALARAEAARAKAARDAMRDEADAAQDLADAKKDQATAGQDAGGSAGSAGASGGGGGGADPFEGLNAAQIKFAKFIASLKPQFDELKRIAAESFLPPLQEAITTLMGAPFDRLKVGVGIMGAAMGAAAISIADAINKGESLDDLTTIFETSGKVIEGLGRAIGSAWGSLMTILAVAGPMTERFVGYIEARAGAFDEFLNAKQASGELLEFFNKAEAAMAQVGRIFDNVFGGIGAIIMANLGPGTGGGMLLTWLEEATAGFANLGGPDLTKFFQDVATNFISVASSVGALIGELIKLGANPAIGQTFDALKEGAPALGRILTAAVEAGPALGTLVATITKIIDKLTDTGAIQTFFGTLQTVANVVLGILENDMVTGILDVTGRVLAFISALTLMGGIGLTAIKIIIGAVIGLTSTIGTVMGGFSALSGAMSAVKTGGLAGGMASLAGSFDKTGKRKDALIANLGLLDKTHATSAAKSGIMVTAMSAVGGAFRTAGSAATTAMSKMAAGMAVAGRAVAGLLLGPVGIAIAVIGLLVGAFVLLYQNNQEFKDGMDQIWSELQAVFADAGKQIMDAIMPLVPMLMDAFKSIMAAIMPLIPLLLSALIPAFTAIISAVVPLITMIITSLVPVFVQIINAVVPLITMLITQLVPVFVTIVQAIVPLITMIISLLVPALVAIIGAIVPIVTTILNILIPVITFLIGVLTNVVAFLPTLWTIFQDVWNNIVGFVSVAVQVVSDVITNVVNAIVAFWTPIWDGILAVFKFIWEAIVNYVTTYINVVMTIITTVINVIVTIWTAVWNGISTFFSNVWNGIVAFVTLYINTVRDVITTVVNAVSKWWNDTWNNISKFLSDTWDDIVTFVGVYIKTVQKIIADIVNAIKSTWESVWNGISKFFNDLWTGITTFVDTKIKEIQKVIATITGAIKSAWEGTWNGISSFFSGIWNGILGAVKSFKTFFEDAFNGIAGFVENAFNGVLGAVRGPINGIIGLVNQAIGALNGLSVTIPDWVPVVGGQKWGLSLPKIPRLAKGGVAMPSAGGTLAVIAEAGKAERVEPLDKDGLSQRDRAIIDMLSGGGRKELPAINIYVTAGPEMDKVELASIVGQELAFQLKKGGY